MEDIIVNVEFTLTGKFIADVISTAFDGGSNYWIEDVYNTSEEPKSQYFSRSVAKGDTIVIIANEDQEKHILNRKVFAEGYKRFIKFCINTEREIPTDPSYIDSEIADMILQFALFKDIVFS